MEDVFYCKGFELAKYLIKNGCEEAKSDNKDYQFAFVVNDNLIHLLNKWDLEKKKFFF